MDSRQGSGRDGTEGGLPTPPSETTATLADEIESTARTVREFGSGAKRARSQTESRAEQSVIGGRRGRSEGKDGSNGSRGAVHLTPAPADEKGVSDEGGKTSGDLSGLLGAVLVLYVDRALGPAGVREVIDRVGADKVLSLVENWEEWVEFEVVLATAIAVSELCHEPDIGRRTGEELFRVLQERGLLVLPAQISLVDAFPDVVESLNTATELRHATVVECTDGMARIEVTTKKEGRTRFLCRTLLGLYASVPSLRNAIGAVVETRCVHRGDEICEFQVRWRAAVEAAPGYDPWTDRVARLQEWAVGLANQNLDHAPEALEAAVLLEEIRRKALADPLTGLVNRAALELAVEEELEKRGTLDYLTLLFVDLDGFKGMNDTYGHAVGDEILIQLGARLLGAVRTSDIVSRVGGDEFVVLFPMVQDGEVVERLVRKVSAVFENPYPVGDQLHWLSGSVGVSRAPEHGHNFTELLEYADEAMYRAKRARKSAQQSTS